jgi:hypothetical protein
MSLSRVTYTSDGSTTQYDITFQYISSTHVKVTVYDADGVSNPIDTGFTFVNPTRVQLTSAPAAGKKIRLYNGISATVPYVDFTNGAELNEKSLDDNSKALLMVAQRAIDDASDGLAALGQVEASRAIASAAAAAALVSQEAAEDAMDTAVAAATTAAADTQAIIESDRARAETAADAAESYALLANAAASSVTLPAPVPSAEGLVLAVSASGAYVLQTPAPGNVLFSLGVR